MKWLRWYDLFLIECKSQNEGVVMANHPEVVAVGKQKKEIIVVHTVVYSDSNIRKK